VLDVGFGVVGVREAVVVDSDADDASVVERFAVEPVVADVFEFDDVESPVHAANPSSNVKPAASTTARRRPEPRVFGLRVPMGQR
jgi:hypothetical protein